MHPNQLEGLKQYFTLDTSLYLTYLIYTRWVKDFHTNILVFNIAQFFPLLNHQLFLLILDKARFNPRITIFFSNYLINRKTQYVWNNFISSYFRADVSVDQGSVLSPILSILYIALIFEKELKVFYSIFLFSLFLL